MPDSNPILDAIPELEKEIPADQFTTLWWGWWMVLTVVILGSVTMYVALRLRRKSATLPPVTPAEQALEALNALSSTRPVLLREFCLRLSLILRRFLEGELSDPALFETHEEFSRRIDSLAAVPEQLRMPMLDLLEKLAEFKYTASDAQDAAIADELMTRARDLLKKHSPPSPRFLSMRSFRWHWQAARVNSRGTILPGSGYFSFSSLSSSFGAGGAPRGTFACLRSL